MRAIPNSVNKNNIIFILPSKFNIKDLVVKLRTELTAKANTVKTELLNPNNNDSNARLKAVKIKFIEIIFKSNLFDFIKPHCLHLSKTILTAEIVNIEADKATR